MENLTNTLLEIMYIIMGCQLLYTAFCTFRDKTLKTRLGTSAFWAILGILFALGSFIPKVISGVLIVIAALLTLFKQVQIGHIKTFDPEKGKERAKKLKNKIFLPVLSLATVALVLAQVFPDLSRVVIGFGALVATLMILVVTGSSPKALLPENDRMIQQISTTSILPQLLAALGGIFTTAGVGEVISGMIGKVVPEGHIFFGVVAYVLGMVIFTMIMGNAFAAFTVITAGIGVPFVFSLGGDPVIAGALAMTAGYCGTLLTPMAGNFNALPAALMSMDDELGVIKAQAPIAITMIVAHILLMYFLAF